jgi:hypothetical protein
MKIVLNVFGILCLPLGGVWVLQGLNILRSSAMSGHRRWIVIGCGLVILGLIVLFFNNRKKAKA